MKRSSCTSTSSPFLTRAELAARWKCSVRRLENLRGLPYIRMGKTSPALYRLADVEAWENRPEFKNSYFRNLGKAAVNNKTESAA